MNLDDISSYLYDRLKKSPLNPKHALSQFRLNNEDYRISAEYNDPTHYPFFYYLGKLIKPNNVIEFGFESGIESGCLCHGNPISNYLGFRHKKAIQYWSPRIPKINIGHIIKKKVNFWNGDITDPEFLKNFLVRKWDCALITKPEEYETNKRYLSLLWNQMSLDGLIVVDKVLANKETENAFNDFCKTTNRPNCIIKKRYGVGLLIK